MTCRIDRFPTEQGLVLYISGRLAAEDLDVVRTALDAGDRVRVLPNHACVVVNMVDEVLLVDDDRVIDKLPVAARGRIA